VRKCSIGTQAGVVAGTVVAGAGLGAWGVAEAMFLSEHDFAVLGVVLACSIVVAALGALRLGRRINESAEHLIVAARKIGTSAVSNDQHAHPGELSRLEAELRLTASRLDEAQQRAQALERSRRELFAWVSTDVRDSAASIQQLAETSANAGLEDIQLEAKRLKRSVEDLMELNGVPGC